MEHMGGAQITPRPMATSRTGSAVDWLAPLRTSFQRDVDGRKARSAGGAAAVDTAERSKSGVRILKGGGVSRRSSKKALAGEKIQEIFSKAARSAPSPLAQLPHNTSRPLGLQQPRRPTPGMASASAAAVVVTLADDDVSFEDELARNPYVLKTWLQYIASKRMARAKVRDGERGGG